MNMPPRKRPQRSQSPSGQPPAKAARPLPEPEPEYEEDYVEDEYIDDEEEEEYYAPPPPPPSRRTQGAQRPQQPQRGQQQPQRGQQSQRMQQSQQQRQPQSRKGQGRQGQDDQYDQQGQYGKYGQRGNRYGNVPVQSRRDPFPMVIGAVIGALVVGLIAIVFLLVRGNNTVPTATSNTPVPNAQVTTVDTSGNPPPTTSGSDPPRMPLEEFIKLYEDPAKRPLVIDVRNKDIYDQGHIKGAESWPEADIDARVVKLPKDKLIVAYCQ